mgnify:FL=1
MAEQQTTVLLETMAGKGTEVGKTFAELQAIIERINLQDKIGVCLILVIFGTAVMIL